MQIDDIVIENYEKRLAAAMRKIDTLCAENSQIRLDLMRAQAENERLKSVLFPPQMDYQKVGGFKVYGS